MARVNLAGNPSGIKEHFKRLQAEAAARQEAEAEKERKIAAGELWDLESVDRGRFTRSPLRETFGAPDSMHRDHRPSNAGGGASRKKWQRKWSGRPICQTCHMEGCSPGCICEKDPCRECKSARSKERRKPGKPRIGEEPLGRQFSARLSVDHALFLNRSSELGLRFEYVLDIFLLAFERDAPVNRCGNAPQTSSLEGNPKRWGKLENHWRIPESVADRLDSFRKHLRSRDLPDPSPRVIARHAFDFYILQALALKGTREADWSSSLEEARAISKSVQDGNIAGLYESKPRATFEKNHRNLVRFIEVLNTDREAMRLGRDG
jgi:hypothetical protein